ncbi:hypothetical protein ROJ8625_01008 [Roseivivax jejudonensis]|uniref:Uncharacterized protein n=1 Tax=Roseivivax jejudonensis TaxID=1529041 RepID=A0A1X6YM30_9RHOB|nr:hypothetical protein [Roseivivax jejudonensis]SLN24524.1 hypothetical protein ROJ8625_01008 [Roseivivax jejudonensis]
MLTALTTIGAAFASGLALGTLPPGMIDEDIAADDTAETDTGPEIVLPLAGTEEPCFDDFRPGSDTLVIVYPSGTPPPDASALRLSYDPDYDETEVRLATETGARLVCYLPGVTPEEIDPAGIEFLSDRDAAAELTAREAPQHL